MIAVFSIFFSKFYQIIKFFLIKILMAVFSIIFFKNLLNCNNFLVRKIVMAFFFNTFFKMLSKCNSIFLWKKNSWWHFFQYFFKILSKCNPISCEKNLDGIFFSILFFKMLLSCNSIFLWKKKISWGGRFFFKHYEQDVSVHKVQGERERERLTWHTTPAAAAPSCRFACLMLPTTLHQNLDWWPQSPPSCATFSDGVPPYTC